MTVFNLLLAWEYFIGEEAWMACAFGLTGGGDGNGSEMVGQPQ
jgi:hypothetical protein